MAEANGAAEPTTPVMSDTDLEDALGKLSANPDTAEVAELLSKCFF